MRALSFVGLIVLCGCVLEAAAATQFKKITSLCFSFFFQKFLVF